MSAEPTYPHGPVINYGAILDYEPRISDPTGKGNKEAWGRGVPRNLVVYAFVAIAVLLVVSYIGPLQLLFDVLGTVPHLIAVAVLGGGAASWAWAMPPGGVRIHLSLPAIARGLQTPRHLVGWVAAEQYPAGWAPGEVVVEPDFAGEWPTAHVVGPATIVRSQAASRRVRPGARAGEVGLVLIAEEGPRRGGPARMDVPAGHIVELRAPRAEGGRR